MLSLAGLHSPYPMLFAADFKEKVWGGRRLESWFENMPPGPAPVGEAWVLSAHPNGPTRIANGRLAGRTLAELCPDFPLLIKVLSCEADLSIQVHPPDHYPRLPIGESGKSEVWLVLEAAPGASILHGLATGVTPELLRRARNRNRRRYHGLLPAGPGRCRRLALCRRAPHMRSAPGWWWRKFSNLRIRHTDCGTTGDSE